MTDFTSAVPPHRDTAPIRRAAAATTVVVFAGGQLMTSLAGPAPVADVVIAADSGLDQARRLGYDVDLVVGDLDSVSPAALAAAEASGIPVERHPVAKDATDLELALDAALAHGADEIVVIGGYGGRVDHFLAGALALTRDQCAGVTVRALVGPARLEVIRHAGELTGDRGELVTLLAVRGPVSGVTTTGLLYPLQGETLHPGSTRGVSNQLVGPVATVRVTSGVLLAVLPGEVGPDPNPAPESDLTPTSASEADISPEEPR